MRIWIKHFNERDFGFKFFDSEICTDKNAKEDEVDFDNACEFVSIDELESAQETIRNQDAAIKEIAKLRERILLLENTLYQNGIYK